jgi:uncharacterized protein
MSERDGYQPGVPCWVDTWQPDPEAAVGFYTELFGWEAEPTADGDYFMCRLRGRDVAAVGRLPGAGPAAWTTYVQVLDPDATATKARDAGGSVVREPFDALDGGRMSLLADPAGAVFGVWGPGAHRGAQLVNEPGAWSISQLASPDPEGAKAFYGAVLGWETDTFGSGDGAVTMWRVPGYVGGEPEQPVSRDVVAVMAPGGDAPPSWNVDFWVADVEETAAKAGELGGSTVVPPFATPVGTTAILADPQGASFSVSRVGPR